MSIRVLYLAAVIRCKANVIGLTCSITAPSCSTSLKLGPPSSLSPSSTMSFQASPNFASILCSTQQPSTHSIKASISVFDLSWLRISRKEPHRDFSTPITCSFLTPSRSSNQCCLDRRPVAACTLVARYRDSDKQSQPEGNLHERRKIPNCGRFPYA